MIRLSATQKFTAYVVLAGLSALMLLPFVWMLISSVKTNSQLFTTPILWWVWPLHLDNYAQALALIPFWSQLRNTALLSVLTVVGTVLSSSFTAYGLAKVSWIGRRLLLGVLIVTMLLPAIVTLVPTYVIFRDLGWVNTYLPLVVPAFLGTPYYIFLFRQFFLRIPESVSEAARIDGASELRIYARIIMPLSRPVVVAVAALAFVQSWTDYLGPLIYLNNPDQWTLSLGLTEFLTKYSVQWNYMMAASVVFTLPLIIVFFLGNKYILSGISFTADVG
ncbi:carbohydrate ABC transporter permease [Pseudonocardia sp. CA-142604]|uniref:carbohydrate ABC transporter permease n=1 Tax=Pseudonocardia sp. CA-142604 TaxID=3240024 RepID=UPI003D921B9D